MLEIKKLDAKHFKRIDSRVLRQSGGKTGVLELYLMLLPYLVDPEVIHPVSLFEEIIKEPESLEALQESLGEYLTFYNAIIHSFDDITLGKTPRYLAQNLTKYLPEEIGVEDAKDKWIPMIMEPVDLFFDSYNIDQKHFIEDLEIVIKRFDVPEEFADVLRMVLISSDLYYATDETRKQMIKEFGSTRELVVFLLLTTVMMMPDFIAIRQQNTTQNGSTAESFETGDEAYKNVGRNDPCPCGSGKKYKKCCLKKQESPMKRLSTPKVLGKKALNRSEIEEYYHIFNKLLTYVQHDYAAIHNKTPLDAVFQTLHDGSHFCSDELMQTREILDVREHLMHHPELIDRLLTEQGHTLSKEDQETLKGFKKMVFGEMFAMQPHQNKSIIVWNHSDDRAYLVYGLYDDLAALIGSYPKHVELLLLPFKGRIVFDGLMLSSGIEFGNNMLEGLVEEYQVCVQKHGVTLQL